MPGNDIRQLPPEVLEHMHAPAPTQEPFVWGDDGAIHPGFRLCRDGVCDLSLASDVAAWSLGLPLTRDAEDAFRATPSFDYFGPFDERVLSGLVDTSGQARGVAVLWLAAQSTPRAEAALRDRLVGGGHPDDRRSTITFQWCPPGSEPGVQYGVRDGVVALALLGMPRDNVRDVLHQRWDELIAPATTTDELLAWFGFPSSTASGERTFFGC